MVQWAALGQYGPSVSTYDDRLLTVAEAAERLGVSEKYVRRLVWAHEIRHNRLGRAVRIPENALTEWRRSTEVGPAAGAA